MITMSEIVTIVRVNTPYDTGYMYSNGVRFSEDATKYTILFDGNAVPYISYTEYEWVSPRWKGKQNPNENWIRVKTTNDLIYMINNATTNEKKRIMKHHERTILGRERALQDRNQMKSQGTLQSIKGNKR